MDKSQLSVAEFIYQCNLRINNSINDEIILGYVSEFGYDVTKLQVGRGLLDEVIQLSDNFDKEHGEVSEAYSKRDEEKKKANVVYYKHKQLAKVAFKKDNAAKVALHLSGSTPRTYGAWINRIRGFYNNLLANESWIGSMAQLGNGAEKLNAALELVKSVDVLNETISREKGDAQTATLDRDAKIDELEEWVSDYEVIARIALMDNPQLLEKLGIVVKN